ncbi:helix-turn-helix domain-containing protein [Sporomusa silvacetica]|uniref:helix-turn-helix domain-containing protein n=1 Tax=Sporomusa silvacetica TaxID=55504 RepID=UPI000B99E543
MNTVYILKPLFDPYNINATANILHIHRNTLLYRLSRFESETGLAPCRSVDDMIICRLLLQLVDQNSVLP